MISFCKIFYVSFIELLIPFYFLYRYFMGSDPERSLQYFTDGYYENIAGILDAVNVINKELRIYTGFINDTGKELPTIIAFEDILEIGVNMT